LPPKALEASDALFELSNDERIFYQEEDGSLSNGIEIISQPCLLAYHQTQFPWAAVCEASKAFGGKSESAGSCGLHVHFSRDFYQDGKENLHTVKLLYLFEKFWTQLYTFSRRKTDNHYCKKYDTPALDLPPDEKISEVKGNHDRYFAVNLTNERTIEIRLYKGTLNPDRILAAIEMTDFLVRYAKRKTVRQLQHAGWKTLVNSIKAHGYENLYKELTRLDLLSSTTISEPPVVHRPAPRSRSFAFDTSWENPRREPAPAPYHVGQIIIHNQWGLGIVRVISTSSISSNENTGCEFDPNGAILHHGHNLDGLIATDSGWWCYPSDLRLATDTEAEPLIASESARILSEHHADFRNWGTSQNVHTNIDNRMWCRLLALYFAQPASEQH